MIHLWTQTKHAQAIQLSHVWRPKGQISEPLGPRNKSLKEALWNSKWADRIRWNHALQNSIFLSFSLRVLTTSISIYKVFFLLISTLLSTCQTVSLQRSEPAQQYQIKYVLVASGARNVQGWQCTVQKGWEKRKGGQVPLRARPDWRSVGFGTD